MLIASHVSKFRFIFVSADLGVIAGQWCVWNRTSVGPFHFSYGEKLSCDLLVTVADDISRSCWFCFVVAVSGTTVFWNACCLEMCKCIVLHNVGHYSNMISVSNFNSTFIVSADLGVVAVQWFFFGSWICETILSFRGT